MSKRKIPIWQPPADIAAKMPAGISGNAINGRGENAVRPPRYIMWTRPDKIAHGRVQQHVNDSYESHPLLSGAFGGPERRAKPSPVAPVRQSASAEEWTRRIKDFARANGAELVGIARIDPSWVFEGQAVPDPFIVVMGVYMKHENLATAPEATAAREVADQYNRGHRLAFALTEFVRGHGYNAHGHGGPGAGPIQLVPAALAAGLGELGKHGSIINDVYGSSFRLAGVTTDLPLVADRPADFAAQDFCLSCQVCTNACPPGAISDARQTVRGVEKWYVDFDKCMPFFASTWGCGICIAVCPWSKPGTAPRLAEKMLGRRAQQGKSK